MPEQIKIVATGPCDSIDEYLQSQRWQADRPGFIIDRSGTIHGGNGQGNVIAIDNVGELVRKGGRWLPIQHSTFDIQHSTFVPYEICSCGKAFEMMGDRQLSALRRLLKSLLSQFHIHFPYDNQLGTLCPRALAGKSGIYFASSFDRHRTDIHPQIELIHIIKSLAE